MRHHFYIFLFFLVICFDFSTAQTRKIISIPDIPGYHTLKGDFHMHTVFSDGTVWPTVRVEEAWREGLDVISITDHIEYRPHSKDIVADHNRPYEIARPLAEKFGIILIRGAEITRSMPPGHLNALFIQNANLLDREDVFDALKEARDQEAFILWNHPGWKAQQPDTTLWWDEHTRLLNAGMLHGIEVYNFQEYYPEAFDWAQEKKLTMFGNSDIHQPRAMDYEGDNSHGPLTLVFSKTETQKGVREALFARRTAVFFDNTLMGVSSLLEPLFFASIKIDKTPLSLKNGQTVYVGIENTSDIDYELEQVQPGIGFDAPEKIVLKAHRITPLELSGNADQVNSMSEVEVYYKINNLLVGSNENLVVVLSFPNR